MNNRRRGVVVIAVVLAVIVIWTMYHRIGGQSPVAATPRTMSSTLARDAVGPGTPLRVLTPPTAEIGNNEKEQQVNNWYSTPISVFGKVVDQVGNPITDAIVDISIADQPSHSGSTYTKSTNSDGRFSLTGAHGIAFSVQARKEGYSATPQSKGHRNVVAPAKDDSPQPSEASPIELVLRKKGPTEPLITKSSRQLDLPSAGKVRFDLKTGRTGNGDLEITSQLGNVNERRFAWRYQLKIAGGGLLERSQTTQLEAPAEGYVETAEIEMKADARNWTSDMSRDYFAKLPDGTFALLKVNFYPGSRNFVVVESYLNPTGSRNLEFDPSKQINK